MPDIDDSPAVHKWKEEQRRKLQAKRFNEHLKLSYTFLNACGLIVFGAGVLQPLITQSGGFSVNWSWVVLSAMFHVLSQALIRLMRLE